MYRFLVIYLFHLMIMPCVYAEESVPSVKGATGSNGIGEVSADTLGLSGSFVLKEGTPSITDTTGLNGVSKVSADTLDTLGSSGSFILISKTNRMLVYIENGQEVLRFPVAFGERSGKKQRRGDRRTPEGEYQIVAKHGSSKYHKFLWFNYPNAEDARRGLDAGLISKRDYEAITKAVENDTIPPQHTRLGGYIGIHGGKAVRVLKKTVFLDDEYDWTLGCIAAKNQHIDRLYGRVKVGIWVLIE